MRAEDLPQPLVAALGEQVQVELAQRRQEPVGVGRGVCDDGVADAGVVDLQAVVDEVGERHRDREQPGFQMLHHVALTADDRGDLDRVRTEGTDHGVAGVLVRTEHGMRVVVLTGQQAMDVGRVRPQMCVGELIAASRHLALIPCVASRVVSRTV